MMNRFYRVYVNNEWQNQETEVHTNLFTYDLAVISYIILANIVYGNYTVALNDGKPQLRIV